MDGKSTPDGKQPGQPGGRDPSCALGLLPRGTLGFLGLLFMAGGSGAQEAGEAPGTPPGLLSSQLRPWREGVEIRLRVPLASESHELMTAVSFPETGIRSAVTGWGPSALTAIQKGNLLFLRLSRQAEGQLNVIGDSGTHYLLYLEAVDPGIPTGYDAFVKIVRPELDASGPGKAQAGRHERPKPRGALDLIRLMRLGEAREGTRILRAKGELVYTSDDVELRLLFVYDASPYVGRIYEVRNRSVRKLALDASRFRAAGEDLILSGLRENVIPPGGGSRLYTLFWRP
jgi:hypothetical protein